MHCTGGKTIKFHKLSHTSQLMFRLGSTQQFDSNFYESDHRFTKALHNQTIRRSDTFMKEMVSIKLKLLLVLCSRIFIICLTSNELCSRSQRLEHKLYHGLYSMINLYDLLRHHLYELRHRPPTRWNDNQWTWIGLRLTPYVTITRNLWW